ncbi:dynein axonemal assembly factor 5 isoform X2 [Ictalurus punctatus]|uniref:Dynein axonemal assembly factor 5 isoform X2 n=1 Tax=Ictalurus punctatus TaxID=7998 RepID=W5UCV2_ICTPU|nr:dynein axonemal assembly factor 5 isoform X2 [Ictalurus punctatus]
MAVEEKRAATEIIRSLAPHLNCLNGCEKRTRKRALDDIKKETIEKGLSSTVLQEVFACLLKSLLRCLSDPSERCREVSIQIIGDFIRCVSNPESSLPYIMPSLAQRICGKETVEPAEELRLSMMEVLSLIVEVCGRHLAPYLDDMIKILQKTITDPFPDVIKESCKCTVHFARIVPDHFHMQAECLVKPLMQTISHRHSRVRMAVIEATGAVVLYGTAKTMDDVLSHMAQRLFDNSPQVRKAVTLVSGDWLLNLKDRYSYFHKLIPLLLSSLNDENLEIRALACELWRQVGNQWEKENEDDLKDKMDFLLSPTLQYPPGVERPGLGCRELVVRNLSKLMPALCRDACDWLGQTRVKTVQLLQVLLLHAEDHCTQHLQQLLTTLYHACTDSEQDVRTNGLESARLLGVFVSPEVFIKLLLAHVKSSSSCSRSPWAPLMVLAAMLKGSNRKVLGPQLLQVGHVLAHPDVCQESQQTVYVEQLLACVEVLLEVCEEDCGIISLPLLKVLVTVQCESTDPQIHTKAEECVLTLSLVLGLSNVHELYRQHMAQLLQWLLESQNSWSTHSIQKTQLEIITFQSGPVVGEFLPELMPLLKNCLLPSQDPEMRLHIFTMLSKLLLNSSNTLDSQGNFYKYLEVFLQELLLPNLVWHAGRTAAAVRTSALSCLLAMLQGGTLSKEQVLNMEAEFSAYLISALEEDSQLSRLLACRSISSFITVTEQCLNPDTLNKIYPVLLKRIDDSSQEVRAEALKALSVWLSSLDKNHKTHTYCPNLEFIFQHLLLYLDDPDHQIRLIVLEVLKASCVADPVLLQQKVEELREKQCNSEYCDQLLQYIQSL